MIVTFELNEKNASLTDEEKRQLEEAKKLPIVYDDDSPEMTEEMEQAFRAARRAKKEKREPLTLYLPSATMKKVKGLGGDYMAILGKLVEQAVDEYRAAL